ncbi:MAG TPA: MFS transporter [Steroidobacteraceae bacterium]|jgi:MHS family citrate/tricarballylate:H+ symporter-like MFS transporter|nr:MFS transporter [Steroidobacteraceae bacterium]
MSAPAAAALHPARMPARDVAAVVAGNALEFYDFIAYAFFALQISRTFFPARTPGTSLLLSLATFGAGFLMRPLGAAVLGRFADRGGRRPAMLVSFALMGLGMVGLALTPSYRSIGLAAPLLVIAWRLLQGFSVGGEVGPALAYLVEAAPPGRRGLYGSLQPMSADAAAFCAGLVGVALSSLLTPAQLDEFGWRIAFLIGAAIVPVGLMLRRALPETLADPEPPSAPATGGARSRVAVLGFGMLASATVIGYVQTYFTTYAADTLGMRPQLAFLATLVSAFCMLCCDPLGGWLSDRVGRRPVMLLATALLAACTYPAFLAIVRSHSAAVLYGACALLGILTGLNQGPVVAALTESLPRRVRAGTLSLVYALAIAVFGGSTQFVVKWLLHISGNPLAPGWYMLGAALLGLVSMSLLRESAPLRLARAP